MKKFIYRGATIATFASVVFVPVLGNAQVIEIDSETDGFLNATTDMVATPTETTIDIDAGAEVGAETSTTDAHLEATTSSNVVLRTNAEGVAVISPSQVNTSNDLEIFIDNTLAQENSVKDVQVETGTEGESMVEVVYSHQSRLFGLMPITLKSSTTVVSDGNEIQVDTKLSWWSFLVTDKERIENEISDRIRDNATIMMSSEYKTNASTQAEIVAAIVSELDSYSSIQVGNS